MFDRVLNALPRGYSKSTSLTKGEGSSRKKVMKNETGVGCDAKQFLQPIFFDDTIFAPSYFSNRF